MASTFENYKTRYIVDSLCKISHKKTEHYVINAILCKLDDLRIRPVFQQFIDTTEHGNRSYLDLYFPALKYGIEVYEDYHMGQIEHDNARLKNIENTAGITVKVIDCTKYQTLATINKQIDDVVIELKYLILMKGSTLSIWPDDGNDTTFQYHLARGFIDVNECEYFKTLDDITKTFSLTESPYKGYQAKGAVNVDWLENTSVFWPNIKSKHWENTINDGRTVLTEVMRKDGPEKIKHMMKCIESDHMRITFLKDKDVFGNSYYTYIGNFKIDKDESLAKNVAVWKRIGTFHLLKDKYFQK